MINKFTRLLFLHDQAKLFGNFLKGLKTWLVVMTWLILSLRPQHLEGHGYMSLAKEVSKGFKNLLKKDTDERKRRLKGNKGKEIQKIQRVVIRIKSQRSNTKISLCLFYRLIIRFCGKIYSTCVVSNSFKLNVVMIFYTSLLSTTCLAVIAQAKFLSIYNYYFH